jgi:membrane dipeptidase
MIILDAHQDIAFNEMLYNRDYRQSALTHREREADTIPAATLGLPDALLGRVALVFGTLFAAPESKFMRSLGVEGYTTPKGAYQQAMKQMDYYQRLSDEDDRVRLVRTQAELDAVLATWDEGTDAVDHKQGLVILMEGADPIIEPQQFAEWYERGVRVVGTAWGRTRYSGGTGEPGGLTTAGRDLLNVMADYNAILDLSHMAEQAFYESLDAYPGPIIASHSNPRRFCNSDRHLSDDMIQRLAARDGVMGVVLYNRFLNDSWKHGDRPLSVSVVLDAIDHICQIAGDARHVGIGSDFDGGFGADSIPEELDTVGDLVEIAKGLRQRGYDETHIQQIMSDNMLRKLREGLPD